MSAGLARWRKLSVGRHSRDGTAIVGCIIFVGVVIWCCAHPAFGFWLETSAIIALATTAVLRSLVAIVARSS